MDFRIDNLEEGHPARGWKGGGDIFGLAGHLERLVNRLYADGKLPHAKIEEFKRDQEKGRFLGFLAELRATAFFLSCGIQPTLQTNTHASPDIVLKEEKVGVEVKARIAESTVQEIYNQPGRQLTKETLNLCRQRGIRAIVDALDKKTGKLTGANVESFVLYVNTMCGGVEMHIDDIKVPIREYFKKCPEISAIIIDDRYCLDGEEFHFVVFANGNAKYPLSDRFLEKMCSSGNQVKIYPFMGQNAEVDNAAPKR